ncbi:MAG: OmpA family protein [Flavobacteriales bacterium]|nr:OmpA family protein [Flavobacteriales bacterium]MCB9204142.1 OmpA family protein [Flavobacteriales bacterium]
MQITLVLMKALIPLLFLSFSAFGQERFEEDTVVKGRVLGDGWFETRLVDCKVSVAGTDGMEVDLFTNEFGEFYLTNEYIKPCHSYLLSILQIDEVGRSYFHNKTAVIRESELLPDSIPLVRDYVVTLRYGRLDLPYIFFDKNSTQLTEDALERLWHVLYELMDSPRFLVEIGGHACWDEQNPDAVGLNRAQTISDWLINEGLENHRLRVVSHGVNEPIAVHGTEFNYGDTLSVDYINALEDSSKIQHGMDLNRFVDFRLVGLVGTREK